MELCVDLVEITRIPYHELETVYLSANIAIIPHGRRIKTKIANGNKSVKFTPHKFTFFIDDTANKFIVITIFSQLTDNRQIPISRVSIPIKTISYNSLSTASLKTTLLSHYTIAPIITVSIGINKFMTKKALKHPDVVTNVDYSNYESAPTIEFDSFGRLKPPRHYIEKCTKQIDENPEFFLNLILNDSLRKFVLDKATEFYSQSDSCVKIVQKKKPPIKGKPKCDHPPQPPNDPPNPRRIRNDEFDELPLSQNAPSSTPSVPPPVSNVPTVPNVPNVPNVPSVSNVVNVSGNSISSIPVQPEMTPVKTQSWTLPISKKAGQPRTGPKVQQQQIPQSQHKNESPPKSFIHTLDPLDKKVRTKPQPPPDVEIQKPLIKKKTNEYESKTPMRGLLQPKLTVDDKAQTKKMNRSICVSKQKQKVTDDSNDYEPTFDHRAAQLMPMTSSKMKPKPPPQMQCPMVNSQPPIDTGVSPRRSRQAPEF